MHCLIVLSSELTRPTSPDLRSNSPELCPALLINNHVAYTSNVMSPLICYSDRKHTETGGLRVGELRLCHTFLFKQNTSGSEAFKWGYNLNVSIIHLDHQ